VILKLSQERTIRGVTTAACIWLAAAVGMSVGAGRFGAAAVGAVLALLILTTLGRFERFLGGEE